MKSFMQENGATNTVIHYCVKKRSLERQFNMVIDAIFVLLSIIMLCIAYGYLTWLEALFDAVCEHCQSVLTNV